MTPTQALARALAGLSFDPDAFGKHQTHYENEADAILLEIEAAGFVVLPALWGRASNPHAGSLVSAPGGAEGPEG